MPIYSLAILLLYLTHQTLLNPHINYQHHTKLIISHLSLYIIFLIKVSLKEQDLMVFQTGFSNLSFPQYVSPCRISTTTASSRHFFPAQWKNSIIHPIKKVNNSTQPNQYRPIFITHILSRILEKYMVKDHIYLCLTNPLIKSRFDDQFAFRPTGSPTSAIIYLPSVITSLLTFNKFVRLIALDFPKAYDTLNHSTLISNMASLQLDDSIYNLLISFFKNRKHSTKFLNKTSSALPINSSVVQGFVLSPSSFILNASSLKPVIPSIN